MATKNTRKPAGSPATAAPASAETPTVTAGLSPAAPAPKARSRRALTSTSPAETQVSKVETPNLARPDTSPVAAPVETPPTLSASSQAEPALTAAASTAPASRPSMEQIRARAYARYLAGSRDTLGNWFAAEHELSV